MAPVTLFSINQGGAMKTMSFNHGTSEKIFNQPGHHWKPFQSIRAPVKMFSINQGNHWKPCQSTRAPVKMFSINQGHHWKPCQLIQGTIGNIVNQPWQHWKYFSINNGTNCGFDRSFGGVGKPALLS
jgi:hypothetical protein